jgi:hypothetical protein
MRHRDKLGYIEYLAKSVNFVINRVIKSLNVGRTARKINHKYGGCS